MKNLTNLKELLEIGLATTSKEIEEVLNCATRGNDFYVGTDVKKWLSSFEALTLDDMIENFSNIDDENEIIENSYLDFVFEELTHDNSYNWGGNSNCDIDFKILRGDNKSIYMYVRVHVGSDIRAGYTHGMLLDLDTYDYTDYHCELFGNISNFNNSVYLEIEGVGYSIQGDITSGYLSIYNHTNYNDIEVYASIYEFDNDGFMKEARELVLENLEILQ